MGENSSKWSYFSFFSLYFIRFKWWRLIIFKLNTNFVCKFVFFTSAIICVVLFFHLLGRFSKSSPLHSRARTVREFDARTTYCCCTVVVNKTAPTAYLLGSTYCMWTVSSDSSTSEQRKPDVFRYHQSWNSDSWRHLHDMDYNSRADDPSILGGLLSSLCK